MLKKFFSALTGSEQPKIDRPIFIVGCGRSGTTLLFDLLAQHPGLARTMGYPDGEDHEGWIKHGKCAMAGIGNVDTSQYGTGINGYHACLHMTEQDVTGEIVESMHEHYWQNVLQMNRKKRVLNKQPHLSNKLDYVLGIFPDAKIIHIIRDCQPMVASWMAIMKGHPSLLVYWPEEEHPCLWLLPKPENPVTLGCISRHERFYPGGGAKLWIDYWCKTNTGIEPQMKGRLQQLLVIRYEDLIVKPQIVLNKIAEFCELPDYRFETAHLEQNRAQLHTKLMTPELEEAIRVQAHGVRCHFGYDRDVANTEKAARLVSLV
jgi:hypothetical protein